LLQKYEDTKRKLGSANQKLYRERLELAVRNFHESINTIEIAKQLSGMAAEKVLTLPVVEFELRERGTIAGMLFKAIEDNKAWIRFVQTLPRLCYKQETRQPQAFKSKRVGLVTCCKRLDLCWPQWVHFGSQEHHRTSWNSMESHGTSWDPMEPHGIPWNLMGSHGTSWNPTEPHGIPRKLMESHGTSWNLTEAHGIPRNLMESHGSSWNPMEPHGIPWKALEHGRIFWLLTNDYK
jgi:hypothetical protein